MIHCLSAAAVDWRRERTRPFHHRRVKMGVRDSDGIDAAETFDHRQSRVVARKRCNPTGYCRRPCARAAR